MASEQIERVVDVGGRDLRFTVTVASRDIHTHGELGRCDRTKVCAALAQAADQITDALRHPAAADNP
jgi:hypothetical protein